MSTQRKIAKLFKGQRHGPIIRLFSPHDLGELLKPFVFLDFLDGDIPEGFGFGFHPHSGIATLSYQLHLPVAYVDTEGQSGVLEPMGLEWMRAGGGAWHKGHFTKSGKAQGFQLWLALPPGIEDGPSWSQYFSPQEVPEQDGVRILLGDWRGKRSPIQTPYSLNYFDLKLTAGENFPLETSVTHTKAWIYVYGGEAIVNGHICMDQGIVFADGQGLIEITALKATRILFGSSESYIHPLICGQSSVHTNPNSLQRGEAHILEIGKKLQREGKLKF